MKLIKISMAAMGLLILLGFAFVGYVTYQRMTGTGQFAKAPNEGKSVLLPGLAELEAFAATPFVNALGLPNNARVEAIHIVGDHVLLLIRTPATDDRLYVINPRTGTVNGAIAIGSVPPLLPGAVAPVPVAMPPVLMSPVAAPPSPPPPAPTPNRPPPQPMSKPTH